MTSPQDLQIVVIAANSPALCKLRTRSDLLCGPSSRLRSNISESNYRTGVQEALGKRPERQLQQQRRGTSSPRQAEFERANVPALQQVVGGSVGDKTGFQLILHNGSQQRSPRSGGSALAFRIVNRRRQLEPFWRRLFRSHSSRERRRDAACSAGGTPALRCAITPNEAVERWRLAG